MRTRVGFIGLGNIGKPMALRLAQQQQVADLELWVYDVAPEPLAEAERAGARIADSVAALAAAVDIVCVMVRDDDQVRDVLGQVLGAARDRATVVIHSTVAPQTPRQLAITAARHGVLGPHLKNGHVAIASINSPMQCMMKEVCAQCLQKHVDPATGREEFEQPSLNAFMALGPDAWADVSWEPLVVDPLGPADVLRRVDGLVGDRLGRRIGRTGARDVGEHLLLEGEQVTIVDIDNGARLVTYAITGERGSGVIGINGAAAHLVHPGDLVILIAYGTMEDAEARGYQPRVVFVDADNKVLATGFDPADTFGDPSLARGDLVDRQAGSR